MKARILIGVRRNGDLDRQDETVVRPFAAVHDAEIDVPEDFAEKELAVAVPTKTITNARRLLGHGVDTVEFMVSFNGDE